jgi:hypothetical protein
MDRPPPEHRVAPPPLDMRKRNLTSEERRSIVSRLLLSVQPDDPDFKLGRGIITSTADFYHVSRITIRKVWQRALANFRNPAIQSFISSPRKIGNCGRKQKWNRDEVRAAVKEIPLTQKQSIRSLALALGMPKSTLFRMKQDKLESVIMPVSIAIKPLLTDQHKLQRVFFATDKVDAAENKYHGFYDSVHIDEKWFFISKDALRVYIATDEIPPERYAQNRNHLIKVMFLCALARPRFDDNGNCTFDGKIGMWPFVEEVEAQRRSENRPRGTIIMRVVSCDKNRYREYLIQKVLPAIRMKWPDRDRRILIQQDGASAHIHDNDAEFNLHARQGQWEIRLETQPPKSPDTNVLDLSFFRALQSAQWGLGSETTFEGLIRQTMRAFREFEPRKIDYAFLTLQCCLDDILVKLGGNNYKIRHMGKERRLREGRLDTRINVTEDARRSFGMFSLRQVADNNGDNDAENQENIAHANDLEHQMIIAQEAV